MRRETQLAPWRLFESLLSVDVVLFMGVPSLAPLKACALSRCAPAATCHRHAVLVLPASVFPLDVFAHELTPKERRAFRRIGKFGLHAALVCCRGG